MIGTSFKDPEVIYKETPAAEGMGYVEYTMPKPCWAVMRFKVEPGESKKIGNIVELIGSSVDMDIIKDLLENPDKKDNGDEGGIIGKVLSTPFKILEKILKRK